jgi:hypothetical protein
MTASESDRRDEGPSGLPDRDAAEAEPEPLGPPESRPDGEGRPERGDDAMPGIPSEGEPPSGG